MHNLKKRIMSSVTAGAVAAAALFSDLPVLGQFFASAETDTQIIVSLGDSYSAGDGLLPYYGQISGGHESSAEQKVESQDWIARRSTNSWGSMLTLDGVSGSMGNHKDTNWFFAAASGAEVKNIKEPLTKNYSYNNLEGSTELPPQIDIFNDIGASDVDYVTITIGGNDIGFVEIVTAAFTKTATELSDLISEKWELYDSAIKGDLKQAYIDIADAAGDQATIIVAGYPRLIDSAGISASFGFFTLEITPDKAAILNNAVDQFNSKIEALVKECKSEGLNICFAPVSGEFNGHGAGNTDEYINQFSSTKGTEDYATNSLAADGSLHPNAKGAKAYAKAVQAVIDEIEAAKKPGGTCGEKLTWSLDDGVLTISGEGAMADYEYIDDEYTNRSPWDVYSDSITSVVIESGVTSIGNCAFCRCGSLKNALLPETLNSIGEYAFNGCDALKEIAIPASVTSIGEFAFAWCDALEEITIPSSVTSIGDNTFYGCFSLESIVLPETLNSIGEYAFAECKALEEITIPASVTSIGKSTFEYCSALKEITIPSSVTSIGKNTFAYCSALKEIAIPESVTSISDYAFDHCSSLESIVLPKNLASIKNFVFNKCSALKEITIPASVTSIGESAFAECKALKEITIPASVTSIGEGAFVECEALKEITIPASVTSISDYAFKQCYALEEITIPSSVKSIGNEAFNNCSSLGSVVLPETLNSIGESAFAWCWGLKEITIPASVTSIGEFAFAQCQALKEITIPASVTSIGKGTFAQCYALEEITIPASVTSIGELAFEQCQALEEITIPASVTSIGEDAFTWCSTLSDLYFLGTEQEWDAVEKSEYWNSGVSENFMIHFSKPIADFVIEAIAAQQYTGSAVEPEITVSNGEVTLVKDTDYTVTFENNINGGTATVIVNGIGKYNGTITAEFEIRYPVVPPVVTATAGDGTVTLTWEAVPGATKYYVSQVNDDGTFTTINKALKDTTITVENLTNGTEYTFLVQAYVNKKWSSGKSKYYVTATPKAPAKAVPPVVTATAGDGTVTLTWEAVEEATKYYVSQVNDDGTFTTINKALKDTTITVENLTNGTEYTFLVQSYVNKKWSSSKSDYYVTAAPKAPASAVPPVVTAIAGNGTVTLTWEAVEEATKYYVSQVNDDGTFTTINKALKDTTITVENLTNGIEYTFLVQAYVNKKWSSSKSKYYVTATPKAPASAVPPVVTATAGDGTVTLTWEPVEEATKYYVSQVNDDGTFTTISKALKDTTITVDNLTNGTTYTFLVQSYVNKKWSSSKSKYYVTATPKAPATAVPPVVTATAGDGTVTLTWEAVEGATKYYVSEVNDDGTYTTIEKALKDTTITVGGLTNGTKYTFLVQSYVNKKWSSSKSKYYVTVTPGI